MSELIHDSAAKCPDCGVVYLRMYGHICEKNTPKEDKPEEKKATKARGRPKGIGTKKKQGVVRELLDKRRLAGPKSKSYKE